MNREAFLATLPKADLEEAINYALTKKSLESFVQYFWSVHHENQPLTWNWHLSCICEHLQAVKDGEIKRLIINLPPGLAKSLLVSVYFPAWLWVHDPTLSFLCASASPDVALRDAQRHRDVVQSHKYQALYMPEWSIDGGQDAKSNFRNTANGSRISKTTGQAITGIRANYLIGDDILDASKAFSDKKALQAANEWRDGTFSTRKIIGGQSKEIYIMQRLNENDLTGHLVTKDSDNWTLVALPMEFSSKYPLKSPIGWKDPRTEEGELLFDSLVTDKDVKQIKSDLGEFAYSAQYQQNPVPEAGNIFKRDSFQFYTKQPDKTKIETLHKEVRQLPEPDQIIISCDFNNLKSRKQTIDTDYACIDMWWRVKQDYFLIRQERRKAGLVASIELTREMIKICDSSKLAKVLIEKAANGPSVIQALTTEFGSLIEGVSVQGESKTQRATALTPVVEAGRVYLPDPEVYNWVEYWLGEVTGFPGRRRDDRVDTFSLALLYFEKKKGKVPFSFSVGRELRKRRK